MSLTVFPALCILGIDFLIDALFQMVFAALLARERVAPASLGTLPTQSFTLGSYSNLFGNAAGSELSSRLGPRSRTGTTAFRKMDSFSRRDCILEAERTSPKQQIAILCPELVQTHWCRHILHNKRAAVQKGSCC